MCESQSDLAARLVRCEAALEDEIARRSTAEAALQEAREDYRRILQELPVVICAADRDGSLVFYNREFERLSGYSAEDLQDLPGMLEILLREDEGPCIVNDTNCRKWRIAAKDGREKVIVWSEPSQAVPMSGWHSWKVGLDITELEEARSRVKILQGLLPICAQCKKIRSEEGAWTPLETYIAAKSEADFTHGVCPECLAKLYPPDEHQE